MQTGEQRGVTAVWRAERRARWFFAAHLQGALGTGAGYVALLLLAYEQLGSAWGATAVLIADLAPAMLLGPLLVLARAVMSPGRRPPVRTTRSSPPTSWAS